MPQIENVIATLWYLTRKEFAAVTYRFAILKCSQVPDDKTLMSIMMYGRSYPPIMAHTLLLPSRR